jgi:hypothetical protein
MALFNNKDVYAQGQLASLRMTLGIISVIIIDGASLGLLFLGVILGIRETFLERHHQDTDRLGHIASNMLRNVCCKAPERPSVVFWC